MTTVTELHERVTARRQLPPPDMRRAIRKAAGTTHAEMAELLGVSRQGLAHWEKGTRQPRGKHLLAYAQLLRDLQALAS